MVIWIQRGIEARLCKNCIRKAFWRYSLSTLALGWWGVPAVFLTPVILAINLVQLLATRRLEPVPDNAQALELTPAALQELERRTDAVLDRIRRGQTYEEVVNETAQQARVTPGQVALFIVRLHEQGRLIADGDPFAPLPPSPEQQVAKPATALWLCAIGNFVTVGLSMLVLGVIVHDAASPKDVEAALMLLPALQIIGIAGGLLLLRAARHMRSLQSYRWAMAGSILSMVPALSACWFPIGLAVGIVALATLRRPEVRAAFQEPPT